MAFDLVTSYQGKAHVTAGQVAALQAATFGEGRLKLRYGEGLKPSMTDANTCRIGTGAVVVDGRYAVNEKAVEVKVANGAVGAFRRDLVLLKLAVDPSTGVGSCELEVAKGTAASSEPAAKDPSYEPGGLMSGSHVARMPVARVRLSGLSPTAEAYQSEVPPMSDIAAYVKQLQSMAVGPDELYTNWGTSFGVSSIDLKRSIADYETVFIRTVNGDGYVTGQNYTHISNGDRLTAVSVAPGANGSQSYVWSLVMTVENAGKRLRITNRRVWGSDGQNAQTANIGIQRVVGLGKRL